MAVPKPTPSKAKKPKAEAKRELEEIVEEVTSAKEASTSYRDQGSMGGASGAKVLSHVEQIVMEQAKTRVQP